MRTSIMTGMGTSTFRSTRNRWRCRCRRRRKRQGRQDRRNGTADEVKTSRFGGWRQWGWSYGAKRLKLNGLSANSGKVALGFGITAENFELVATSRVMVCVEN
mmetsp:Transcript_46435/g.86277  ORF Transcript_46435/g.86277 Transcript_46435/m.86277 type:complete len:103 (-) Transcript_46435:129-437(-)